MQAQAVHAVLRDLADFQKLRIPRSALRTGKIAKVESEDGPIDTVSPVRRDQRAC